MKKEQNNIKIGMATHYRRHAACGRINVRYWTDDASKIINHLQLFSLFFAFFVVLLLHIHQSGV
jgi:hypothetical protein